MSSGKKLIGKIKRREKKLQVDHKGYDRSDKQDRTEEVSSRTHKSAMPLLRKIRRRLARALGQELIAEQPKISKRELVSTVERFSYSGPFGIRLTLAAGIIADVGVQPLDIVKFLDGTLKGQYLKVVSITDSTHIRLEDSSLLNYLGTAEKTQITAVADVSSSLNNTYFVINNAANATSYYVWYNVGGAGVDPAVGGKTGIEVDISANATAAAVATASAAAIGAVSASFSASALGAVVTVTNAAVGIATDAVDTGATGFAILVLVQGSAANPTVSENNKHIRFQLLDVKKSYV